MIVNQTDVFCFFVSVITLVSGEDTATLVSTGLYMRKHSKFEDLRLAEHTRVIGVYAVKPNFISMGEDGYVNYSIFLMR